MNARAMKWVLGALVAATIGLASTVQAAPSLTLIGDTGSLRVTTYAPLQIASAPLVNPYGTPPAPAITEVVPNTVWQVDFTPTAEFFAAANSFGGGKTAEMAGKLDFVFTADSPFAATVNVYENGIFSTTGNGTVDASGGLVVSEWDGADYPTETKSANITPLSFGPGGLWLSGAQATGFNGSYSSYRITIDNDLIAEALAGNGSAAIAKKNFTIIITADGSTGGGPEIPEPASLGVLALGGLALLVRRRA